MGRIVAQVRLGNPVHPANTIAVNALVDTGASLMVLPAAYRRQLGEIEELEPMQCELADGRRMLLKRFGPVSIQIEGFPKIMDEVFFVEGEREVEPLLGYIALEKSCATVDMVAHRLRKVDHMDMKGYRVTSC